MAKAGGSWKKKGNELRTFTKREKIMDGGSRGNKKGSERHYWDYWYYSYGTETHKNKCHENIKVRKLTNTSY